MNCNRYCCTWCTTNRKKQTSHTYIRDVKRQAKTRSKNHTNKSAKKKQTKKTVDPVINSTALMCRNILV